MHKRYTSGFTIVELLIVIVIIAILAAVTVVAFNGIRDRAQVSQAKAQLDQARKKVRTYYIANEAYPSSMATAGMPDANGSTYSITSSGSTYCVSVTTSAKSYRAIGDTGQAEVGSCSAGTTNLALNASVTASSSQNGHYSWVTDGISNDTGYYFESSYNSNYVTVDLGSAQFIGRVIVWHYYGDPRYYNDNRVQISADGSTWTTVFNSNTDGTYTETSAGKTIDFTPTSVRYIRNYINGSSNNPGNHWVEIQAY